MTISSQAHQFQVSSVPFSTDVATRLNIKKRRETITYRTLSSRDNINIGYLIGHEVEPSNNLFISDRSTSLTQNRIPSSQDIIIETTTQLFLNVDKFLVTDQFTVETPTKPEVPLFYVHTLKDFNPDIDNFAEMTLLSLEFADYDLQPISVTEYVMDTSTGMLYNNLENSYSSTGDSFSVTFVQYTVKKIVSGVTTIEIFHELISNSPIYTQADFGDLNFDRCLTGRNVIIPGRKVYLVHEIPGGQYFEITMPEEARYAYKETPESRIKVLPPTAIDTDAPWNLRITNGRFITSRRKSENASYNHKYYVAEFNDQTFAPYPPYKPQPEQKAIWLHDSLIHVPKNIAYDEYLDLHVDIIVKDNDNEFKYAYTTDPNKVGILYQGSVRYTAGILSIDKAGGFIEVLGPVRDDDEILVTYFTEENEYEFTLVNFNPINNLDILQQRVVFYVNPEVTGVTGALNKTLYYLMVNSLGEITYSSQVGENLGSSLDPATAKMVNEDFNADGTPKTLLPGGGSRKFYYDGNATESGFFSRVVSGLNLNYVANFSFVDKYTVESELLASVVYPPYPASENYEENPQYLILADVYVGESMSPDELSRFDVRVQGGGIKENSLDYAMAQNAEVAWYWDLNARRPYPGAGAFMAELPQTLLTEHGGDFTQDQLTTVVSRHMKMGGYPIIKSYGIDPTIVDTVVGSGHVSVDWPSYGLSTRYNIYISSAIDTGFVLNNEAPITDSGVLNRYTISDLTPLAKYYLKVGALDTNSDESFGPTVSAITTTVTP